MSKRDDKEFKALIDEVRDENPGPDLIDNFTVMMMRRAFQTGIVSGLKQANEVMTEHVLVRKPGFSISDSGRQAIVDDLKKDNG